MGRGLPLHLQWRDETHWKFEEIHPQAFVEFDRGGHRLAADRSISTL